MDGRYATSCVTAVVLASALIIGGGKVMPDSREYIVRIPDLRAQPSDSMSQGADQVVQSYRAMIADLIGQFQQGIPSNEGKVYAIYLLGELRAREGVATLIENINLKAAHVDDKGGIGRWGMYPAEEALSKIGRPAVNMILDLLPTENDDTRRQLMCMVIADVEGKDLGRMILKQRVDAESDRTRKTSLEKAMKLLEGT
jgi:hypothetical protein